MRKNEVSMDYDSAAYLPSILGCNSGWGVYETSEHDSCGRINRSSHQHKREPSRFTSTCEVEGPVFHHGITPSTTFGINYVSNFSVERPRRFSVLVGVRSR